MIINNPGARIVHAQAFNYNAAVPRNIVFGSFQNVMDIISVTDVPTGAIVLGTASMFLTLNAATTRMDVRVVRAAGNTCTLSPAQGGAGLPRCQERFAAPQGTNILDLSFGWVVAVGGTLWLTLEVFVDGGDATLTAQTDLAGFLTVLVP